MNQQLTINKEYWLKKNPNIEFRKVKRAFYGTYLLRASINICGASVRYYNQFPKQSYVKNPTYDEFMIFMKKHVMRFSTQKIIKSADNRYLHVDQKIYSSNTPRLRIYDVRVLYALYGLRRNKPDGIYFSREQDTLRIYSNDIDAIDAVIEELYVDDSDIKSIASPVENDIGALLSGKEFNTKAKFFKFKVFLKPTKNGGMPNLSAYLESIKDTDEVEVPSHCQQALLGPKDAWSWAYTQRSYMYAKDEDTILLIKLLAGEHYSNAIELIMPNTINDK